MSETKPLPCPFCGGEAEFYRTPVKTKNGGWCDSVVVRCKECEARTGRILYNSQKHPNDEEYDEAANAWNTRKPMERIVEQLKEESKFMLYELEDPALYAGIERAIEIVREEGGL